MQKFCVLHDIPKIHITLDNNRSSSFGEYLSNKNQHRNGDLLFCSPKAKKRHTPRTHEISHSSGEHYAMLPSLSLEK